MPDERAISWIPAWVDASAVAPIKLTFGSQFPTEGYLGKNDYICLQPRPENWPHVVQGLKAAALALRKVPISAIVDAIGTAAGRWCDRNWPRRRETTEAIIEATGLSREIVDRSLDVELRNYTAESLWLTLRREFGEPSVLDSFTDDSVVRGRARAVGPKVVLQVLTGNVPGLPALAIVRTLLVKSALIAKVASSEPTFAASFAASLAEIDQRIGDSLLVTYWDGRDSEMYASAIRDVECVVAYGDTESCAGVRSHILAHQRYFEHGHKLSLGMISARYLAQRGVDDIARQIAHDTSMFNQLACIAPQAYLVEASADTMRVLGSAVASALDAYSRTCPLGHLPLEDAMALRLRRCSDAWRSSAGDEAEMWTSSGSGWTVVVQPEFAQPAGTGNRYITLMPVSSLGECIDIVRPFGNVLQNVALGCDAGELETIADELASLGAARLCSPGRMCEPSLMWRHDGRMCVAELVRWCDIEMHDALEESRPHSLEVDILP